MSGGHCENCGDPTRDGNRSFCARCEKRRQRGQSLAAPKQERLSPADRVLEAVGEWVDADSEDDEAYQAKRRAALRACRAFAPHASSEAIREGLREAKRRGVRVGRPPKLDAESARVMLARLGSVAQAAKALGVDRGTVSRALARDAKASVLPHSTRGEERGDSVDIATPDEASAP